MIRILLTLSVLAGAAIVSQAANNVNRPASHSLKMERTAQHVFQLADADKNGALDPAEQADADVRAEKAIRQLIHDNTIGGRNRLPAVAEPKLADPAAMTPPEFTQHFQALAGNNDASLRMARLTKNQTYLAQPAAPQTAAVVYNGYNGNRLANRFDDGRYLNNRPMYPAPFFYQSSPFQYNVQPVFSVPVQWGMPATAHDSGSKHEPTHKHESSKGESHGHGGHHGK